MNTLYRTLLLISLALTPLSAQAHFQNFLARIIYVTEAPDATLLYARVPLASLLLEKDWQQSANAEPPPYTGLNEDHRPVLDLSALVADSSGLEEKASRYLQLELATGRAVNAQLKASRIQAITTRSPFGYLPAIEQTLTRQLQLPAETLLLEEAVIDLKLRVPGITPAQIIRIRTPDDEWPTIKDQSINILTLPSGQHTSTGPLDLAFNSPPNTLELLITQLRSGIHHVLIGLDHLLFMAVLVMGASSWRRVIHNSLMFTAGHSLTLGLVAFGWLSIPALSVPLIETLIALTILYGFYRLLFNRARSALPLFQVGIIGLLHGLGFANVLEQATGLSISQLLVHWAGFNAGIELGQLLIFTALGLVLWGLPRVELLSRAQITSAIAYPSLLISIYWTLERSWDWWNTVGPI